MAAVAEVTGEAKGDSHDLRSLLCSEERDFLIRRNGDQVKITDLDGKIVGLYFSASWCPPCRRFTPKLAEVYDELSKNGGFEVVFVTADEDEDSFKQYLSHMPWLAVPFSDSTIRDHLDEIFKVRGIPHLVILDRNRKVSTADGVEIVSDHGAEAFPFSPEKLEELAAREEAARRNQTLVSLLTSTSRDFLISNNGNKVPVSELEGKIVGLYFSVNSYPPCDEFTTKLTKIYQELKEKGESFEIVLVSLASDEDSFTKHFQPMPWLALPFKDKVCEKLPRYFELKSIPTLVIIGADGKTLNLDVSELVEEHGIRVYPFTPEKLAELAELEKAKLESQTLESLLVTSERDFVIGKGDDKVPLSDLVGKTILLYFSAQWCGPCRAFMPKLIEAYHEIKAKDSGFEVIFISSDREQDAFNNFFAEMPWLALPFGDSAKKALSRTFKIHGIPSLVVIGPSGRTVTKEARNLLTVYGSDAYPFTEQRLKELEAMVEAEAEAWPKEVKHVLHVEHIITLTRRDSYTCDGCEKVGHGWSFYCEECDFDLHPKCALEESKENVNKKQGEHGDHDHHHDHDHDHHHDHDHDHDHDLECKDEGYICHGEVCYKA